MSTFTQCSKASAHVSITYSFYIFILHILLIYTLELNTILIGPLKDRRCMLCLAACSILVEDSAVFARRDFESDLSRRQDAETATAGVQAEIAVARWNTSIPK